MKAMKVACIGGRVREKTGMGSCRGGFETVDVHMSEPPSGGISRSRLLGAHLRVMCEAPTGAQVAWRTPRRLVYKASRIAN